MYCGYKSMFGCNNLKTMTPELLKRIQSCMFNKKNKDEIIPVSQMNINKSDIKTEIDIDEIDEIKDNIIDISVGSTNKQIEINENIYLIKEKLLKEMTTVAATESTTPNESKLELSTNVENIISPTQKDTLFWCIFILHFGYNEYLQVNRNYGIKELEVKQKIIEYLNKTPGVLKQTNYKITKASVQEILSDFLTSQKEEQLEFGPEMNSIMMAMMSGQSSSSSSSSSSEETKPLL